MPSLPASTILDCIDWWFAATCQTCGAFIDVAWVPLLGDDPPEAAKWHCPECVVHVSPAANQEPLHQDFRRLRAVRMDLGLGEHTIQDPLVFDALARGLGHGSSRVTLFAHSALFPAGGDHPGVIEYVIIGFALQAPDQILASDLVPFPTFVAQSPFRQPHSDASPPVGFAEVVLGRDVFVASVRGHLEYRWNPADPSREYDLLLRGWSSLSQVSARRLVDEGIWATRRESPRGRPPRTLFTTRQLVDAAITFQEEQGRWPTKERLAEDLKVRPFTIFNTIKRNDNLTYKRFLDVCEAALSQRNLTTGAPADPD